ncbi:TetR/AcrR family transcriptional regulator [Agrobacterium tumefaciens]|uniref:TetR/AcrR family transcriptional regulator n=1 Tax=Agrobacterium tumefaciens TaxID=358 RepID=UPI0021D0319D|nr:TetR/AcrR family transcriptional regulator [Agrobacterium tumefaciens]UXS01335.1 TetR/AcrR family transcriptional regulator [Agrobacterium tumefaciens]
MRSSGSDIGPFDRVQERRGGRSERVREAVMDAVRRLLQEEGYSGLTHRAVAAIASVDNATIYRRWPTRPQLVSDMLHDISNDLVPIPDTGSVGSDLQAYLASIVAMLANPGTKKLAQAFFAASLEGDEVVGHVLAEFWQGRFSGSYVMLDKAVLRGELPENPDHTAIMEALVAPAWFRTFISRMPVDQGFQQRCVGAALALAHSGNTHP